jgi:hypothetical protein
MLGTKQPSGNIDDIFAWLRLLPRQRCAQQFSRFFFERAPMFGRTRSQPVVQSFVNIAYQQTDHGTATFRLPLANASKRFNGRQTWRIRVVAASELGRGKIFGLWYQTRRKVLGPHFDQAGKTLLRRSAPC